MPRPHPDDSAEDVTRCRGRREDYQDVFEDVEDEPAFSEEEERPRRRKAAQEAKPRRGKKHEEEEEEESEDDGYGKQLVVHKDKKKSKSSGKEVVRRKKHQTTDEEDSSEEEKKREKKSKKKAKARKGEVITKKAWEPVPRDEVDGDFVMLISDELGQNPDKILEGVEDELLLRHTETGEYNIDGFFEEGIFSKKDQKRWSRCVDKLKTNKRKSEILLCSSKVASPSLGFNFDPSYGAGYGPDYDRPGYGPSRRVTTTTVLSPPPQASVGHRQYNPRCPDCVQYQCACHNLPIYL
ncbi:MAG: hypothetical protein L6R39_004832 [Caloplaca ligustica]|nr:MAG: hypothetical protein L6R39_004832 [Caloplaca ligustica]